ncbi:hypothetical protein SCAR479_11606 [Seiridium cardinale]|uniref:Ribosomal protein/NADH dehydrogenase domain-containing protein n=1 Tax=Seiridium cardinale TaxID=138064 RepID=A0ABR2XD54_9PEZI
MSSKYAFTKALKEVRFLFCQTGEHSAATRQHTAFALGATYANRRITRSFLTRAYPTMKKNNPNTPILLREASGTLPKIYARYELGKEKSQSLDGLTDKQIEEAVTTLVKNDSAA